MPIGTKSPQPKTMIEFIIPIVQGIVLLTVIVLSIGVFYISRRRNQQAQAQAQGRARAQAEA